MLGNYQQSEFDLRFGVAGIPVRVTPWFWAGAVIIGWDSMRLGPPFLMMWVLVMFISIIVHELGHAIVARWLGCHVQETVLYMMGGLAIYHPGRNYTHGKSILISLAGPGAGFILWGFMEFVFQEPVMRFALQRLDPKFLMLIAYGISSWLFINLWWGIINLLPVLPLDGGHVCLGVCRSISPYRGERTAQWISVFVAGSVSAWFFMHQNTYTGVLFLTLAISNWQSLERN